MPRALLCSIWYVYVNKCVKQMSVFHLAIFVLTPLRHSTSASAAKRAARSVSSSFFRRSTSASAARRASCSSSNFEVTSFRTQMFTAVMYNVNDNGSRHFLVHWDRLRPYMVQGLDDGDGSIHSCGISVLPERHIKLKAVTLPGQIISAKVQQVHDLRFWARESYRSYMCYWATSSSTKVRTVVTQVPAEHGRHRLKLRHLNFDPLPLSYSHRTVSHFGSYSRNNAHVLILKRWKWLGVLKEKCVRTS